MACSQAVAAIEAFLDGTPLEVETTGEGWVLDLPSATHPQAEITDVDYVAGLTAVTVLCLLISRSTLHRLRLQRRLLACWGREIPCA